MIKIQRLFIGIHKMYNHYTKSEFKLKTDSPTKNNNILCKKGHDLCRQSIMTF